VVDLNFQEKTMNRSAAFVCSLLAATALNALAAPMNEPSASAQLAARSDSTAAGSATFTEKDGSLQITAQITGLSPGEHGFHIHDVGDCSAADASSAKGHFNPSGKQHGHHDSDSHHGGDMPNLVANSQGDAHWIGQIKGISLTDVVGRSVVIHADPDDYKSQPAGNSGKRVACGVVTAN
jgi:superoxide dismutase, Cu-Zn family